ncbi:unnamed protein product [Prorocentrum cordatum]|uniref:Sel1 repeat family protein n=1 Tax=Prorocentrum cordatum TaxID=2364126 RepID=A0ABN9TAV2_9DINO|nr:unnamed protein product [Polarella glacialis]
MGYRHQHGYGVPQACTTAVLNYIGIARQTVASMHRISGGHTRAAYPLATMQFNGIGANPNCDDAVKLFRAVCERGGWVTDNLADAHELVDKLPDRAALLFLKLAEAGHEVAQVNAAHMFDTGQALLFYPGRIPLQDTDDMRQHGKLLAQRYYEMSAERGSVSSELRLGDYAYYGWGASVSFREEGEADDGANGHAVFSSPFHSELQNKLQAVDHEVSLARYRKTADMGVKDPRMQAFVARGSFNVGFMHQFGLGVQQDLQTARMYYERSRRVEG